MTPEEQARVNIDKLLEQSGWLVQDYKHLNLGASLGIAVREFPTLKGPADYMLFIKRKAVGVLEAKPEGVTLSGVTEQSERYLENFPDDIPHITPLRFAYESTGVETIFRDRLDIDTRSRRVFSFHKPETLQEWMKEDTTLRNRLKSFPPLITDALRDAQTEAIINLEKSFGENHPRALIQMATGSGKTFTAINFSYRLIQHAKAKRVLFLVDRGNLGKQTFKEFQAFATPDDGRKFTEIYNVQHLKSNTIDSTNKVVITTIQRLFSILKGKEKFDESLEEVELTPDMAPRDEIEYNSLIPPEYFDFIVVDECHRSIYGVWRQVLEYFDAFLIGLTATPALPTFGFFNKNLVMEYSYDRAVADGVNVPFEVYRIKTKITQDGSTIEADGDFQVEYRDKMTRKSRWEQLDEDKTYEANELDRSVVSRDQIRTIIQTFKDKLYTDIFPGRSEVPKTLIFAKDDNHAEEIVGIVKTVFGKGNDFCKKITYRTQENPDEILASFRTSYNPRIAVTVEMISTGTDVKPLECLIFLRDVKSRNYFEQMKGRGTRTIPSTDLQNVTPDNDHKTHFIIVDAVGVTESIKTDSRPLERQKSVSFEKLVKSVAMGKRDDDTLTTLAGRLARLEQQISKEQSKLIEEKAGKTLPKIINEIFDALDPDKIESFATQNNMSIEEAKEELIEIACTPFDDPEVRELLINIKKDTEQLIDDISTDTVLEAGFSEDSKEKAMSTVTSFKEYIEENKDKIDALSIIYNQSYSKRHLTYEMIKNLTEELKRPPLMLTASKLWRAYEQLDTSKVKKANPDKLLTNIIQVVRYTLGQNEILNGFDEKVNENYERFIKEKEYSREQIHLLALIKDKIINNSSVEIEDLKENDQELLLNMYDKFGADYKNVIEELNIKLVA
ncbi:DEAD/DEAH box helicase family protein [Aliarcobacter butzleri]|uniref:type I restriction endonuclease subunit R n=1 Tax=Aliarcobacter butzleri TaxID=28197 RepID=UPI003B227B64